MPVEARVLIGWMQREQAVKFLQEECVFDPPLTEEQAEQLWAPYRERVAALSRPICLPPHLPLNHREQQQRDEALREFGRLGIQGIKDVIKIDPRGLIVHQHYVLTSRAAEYQTKLTSSENWFKDAVKPAIPAPKSIQIYAGRNIVNIDVPHGEFFFSHDPRSGFVVQEFMRYVSAWRLPTNDRMLLWAGYHRSYARMVSMAPDANVRSLLMVLADVGTLDVFPDAPNGGLRAIVCGPTPPLFGDFFDDGFFVTVNLRKKRFQLQIRANCVPVDDTTP